MVLGRSFEDMTVVCTKTDDLMLKEMSPSSTKFRLREQKQDEARAKEEEGENRAEIEVGLRIQEVATKTQVELLSRERQKLRECSLKIKAGRIVHRPQDSVTIKRKQTSMDEGQRKRPNTSASSTEKTVDFVSDSNQTDAESVGSASDSKAATDQEEDGDSDSGRGRRSNPTDN